MRGCLIILFWGLNERFLENHHTCIYIYIQINRLVLIIAFLVVVVVVVVVAVIAVVAAGGGGIIVAITVAVAVL